MTATIQQVLYLTTERPSLRADVVAWGWEDPRCVVPHKAIGFSPSWRKTERLPHYTEPLRALADGWCLLTDAVRGDSETFEEWHWTLVREVSP